jgi:serine protease Do
VPDGSPFQEFFEDFFNRNQGEDGSRSRKVQSLGSGFVIDPSGIIITNNHVIAEADEITANFADGSKLVATLIGRDEKTDLAVLKVEPVTPLKAVKLSDSGDLRVGDWVMAIGNPFGFGGTVTVGIVSALERDINSGPYDKFIQTDASINRGNSGGPLFNMDGEVIGVNTAIFSPSGGSVGIGFAVPSTLVDHVVAQLKEFGRTRRGWLGVRIQSVTPEIAEGLGLDKARGALVASVTPDGPAAEAGLENGDVVVLFDGKPIDDMRELPRVVADTEVGKAVEVVVIRRGEEMTFSIELGELEVFEDQVAESMNGELAPEQPPEGTEPTDVLGMVIQDVTPELVQRYGLAADATGLVVTNVARGGPAARADIQEGDLILEVGQEQVASVEDVVAQVDGAKERSSKAVVMRVIRNGEDPHYLAVELDE